MSPAFEHPVESITLAGGVWLEDAWYALKPVDGTTLAIGEPAYHQCNWSYLISDAEQSLLWDTGSGRRALKPVIDRHARATVTAFPSHMHFDHLGAVGDFGPVLLADLSCLRAYEVEGHVTPPEHLYLGAWEGLRAPRFSVARWVRPGEVVTVGARQLAVWHTPGHSQDSVSLWEPARVRLYAADLIYPGEVYAQVPGASLPSYLLTLQRLLRLLPRDAEILCAHGQAEEGAHDMPLLGYTDLEDLWRNVRDLLQETPHEGARRVNGRLTLLHSAEAFEG